MFPSFFLSFLFLGLHRSDDVPIEHLLDLPTSVPLPHQQISAHHYYHEHGRRRNHPKMNHLLQDHRIIGTPRRSIGHGHGRSDPISRFVHKQTLSAAASLHESKSNEDDDIEVAIDNGVDRGMVKGIDKGISKGIDRGGGIWMFSPAMEQRQQLFSFSEERSGTAYSNMEVNPLLAYT